MPQGRRGHVHTRRGCPHLCREITWALGATPSVGAVSRLRRTPDEGRSAYERLAALFDVPLPEPQGWVPEQDPSWELPWEAGWELPPEEDPVAPPPQAGPAQTAPAQTAPQPAGRAGPQPPVDPLAPTEPEHLPDRPLPPDPPASTRVLPSPLRGGRWEPGRRGALALVVVAALGAVLAGIFVLRSRPTEVSAPPLVRPAATASATPAEVVVVAVAGKVKRPGLVRLRPGARVDDALRAAGGALPGTDLGLLNLARLLVDGEQLLVGISLPPGSTTSSGGTLPPDGSAAGGPGRPSMAGAKIDLNAASIAELDGLPGIGPVLAQHILDWRTEHGRFESVDQLREVPGIGEAKYASLRDKVRV